MSAEPYIKLQNIDFDGPLDLLLALLSENKVSVYDIPIALIADQYLDYVFSMEETDLESLSAFIVMAATLMDLKARMLLPAAMPPEEETIDPRRELSERLVAYRKVKDMAMRLRKCEEKARHIFYSERGLPGALAESVPPIDIDMLLEEVDAEKLERIYAALAARRKKAVNEEAGETIIAKSDKASLTKYLTHLSRYLKSHRHFRFSGLFGEEAEKSEVVVGFLALLELMKLGRVRVGQKKAFGEIDVEVVDSTALCDTLLLDLVEG